jgi:hypothetical protein
MAKAAGGDEAQIYPCPDGRILQIGYLGGLYAEQLGLKRSGSGVVVVAAGANNSHTRTGGNRVLLLIICSS